MHNFVGLTVPFDGMTFYWSVVIPSLFFCVFFLSIFHNFLSHITDMIMQLRCLFYDIFLIAYGDIRH